MTERYRLAGASPPGSYSVLQRKCRHNLSYHLFSALVRGLAREALAQGECSHHSQSSLSYQVKGNIFLVLTRQLEAAPGKPCGPEQGILTTTIHLQATWA